MTNWKPDPVLKNALSHGPRMFATLALPFIERYGEDAKKLIYDTVYKGAVEQGQRLAEKAKDRNNLLEFERLQIEDFLAQDLSTPSMDDPARKWVVKTEKKTVSNLSLCDGCEENIPKVWEDMGLDAEQIRLLGELYCVPWDTGVIKGFNPNTDFKFNKLVTRGDAYCEFCRELKD